MTEESAYGRIVGGAGVVLVGNVLGMGLAFVTRVLAANLLDPSGYGALVLGITVLLVVSLIGNLGLYEGLARELPRTDDPGGVFTAGLLTSISLGALLAGTVVVLAGPTATALLEPALEPVLVAAGAGILGRVVFRTVTGGFRGVEDALGRVIVQNVVMRGTVAAFVFAALLLGYGAVGATAGWALGLSVAGVFGVYLVHRRAGLVVRPGRWRSAVEDHASPLLRFSLPLMGAASIWRLFQETDTLLLGVLATSGDLGVYDGAFIVARLLLLFFWPVGFLLLPVFSDLDQGTDVGEQRELYRLTTKWLVVATTPLFFLLAGFPDAVLGVLFGPAYAAGRLPLVVLAVGFYFHVLAGPNRQALTAAGRTRIIFRGTAAALAVNVVLNAVLIPQYGPLGAGIATGVTFVVLNVAFGAILYRSLSIAPFDGAIARVIVGSTAGFAVVYAGVQYTGLRGGTALLAYGTAFVPIHLFVVVFGGTLERRDLELVEELDGRVPVELGPILRIVESRVDRPDPAADERSR